jgi:hypothetical protein
MPVHVYESPLAVVTPFSMYRHYVRPHFQMQIWRVEYELTCSFYCLLSTNYIFYYWVT